MRRLAETVEDFLGGLGEDDAASPLLSGSTIFLIKKRSQKKRSSGVDLLSGSVSLDVDESARHWLETLEEAADLETGSPALRRAAGRRAEAEGLAEAALGVDSIALSAAEEGDEVDGATLSRYDSFVRELASAAPASNAPPHHRQHRRHEGVSVVVAAAAVPPSSSSFLPEGTISVGLEGSSPVSVFSAVESLAPAAISRNLERKRAEQAARKLLQAAGSKLGISGELLKRGGEGGGEVTFAEAAAAAARILRAPSSSRIAGSARGFREVYLENGTRSRGTERGSRSGWTSRSKSFFSFFFVSQRTCKTRSISLSNGCFVARTFLPSSGDALFRRRR